MSNLIQNAAREARAIITCVNSSPECLPFRDRILEIQEHRRLAFALRTLEIRRTKREQELVGIPLGALPPFDERSDSRFQVFAWQALHDARVSGCGQARKFVVAPFLAERQRVDHQRISARPDRARDRDIRFSRFVFDLERHVQRDLSAPRDVGAQMRH